MVSRLPLLSLIAVFVALTLVVTTGAFSSVTATRTVDVGVAGDDAALLQLTPHTGPNGDYAALVDGEFRITFDGVPADGVNQNATTTIPDVFNVTNRGTQTVTVNVTESGNHTGLVTFESAGGTQLDDGSAGVAVPVGATLEVTIVIDTTGQNLPAGTPLLDSITVRAAA